MLPPPPARVFLGRAILGTSPAPPPPPSPAPPHHLATLTPCSSGPRSPLLPGYDNDVCLYDGLGGHVNKAEETRSDGVAVPRGRRGEPLVIPGPKRGRARSHTPGDEAGGTHASLDLQVEEEEEHERQQLGVE
ncbi:hypothetical protein O3P69_010578 [Scylla paramamosain]|uniref:Uncharacterized protein n=1 Tax=Scylla paramamosain TaxID=85552 RepID=A0AAW0TEN0_SCYPA